MKQRCSVNTKALVVFLLGAALPAMGGRVEEQPGVARANEVMEEAWATVVRGHDALDRLVSEIQEAAKEVERGERGGAGHDGLDRLVRDLRAVRDVERGDLDGVAAHLRTLEPTLPDSLLLFYAGPADFYTTVASATPVGSTRVETTIRFPDGSYKTAVGAGVASRAIIEGFLLDGETFLVVNQEEAGGRKLTDTVVPVFETAGASAGEDKRTSYAVGSKSIIVVPVCYGDSGSCGSQYSHLNSDVTAHLRSIMSAANNFFKKNSYNKLSFRVTVAQPITLSGYRRSRCGAESLGRFGGSSSALDVMTQRAYRSALGEDIWTDYDFNVIATPPCSSLHGIGYIGTPGSVIVTTGNNNEKTLAHELGHNLGANHASVMTGGSKGRKAWKDSPSSWSEYGNPHSAMGSGDLGFPNSHFLVATKYVFDWLAESQMRTLDTASAGFTTATHTLRPTEVATSSLVGLQLTTKTTNRYFFIEHRTLTTSGSAALVSWTDMKPMTGGTGVLEKSVLADSTPSTASFADAAIKPGRSLTIDVGTSSSRKEVTITVAKSGNNLVVTVSSVGGSTPPAATRSPTRTPTRKPASRPTRQPTRRPSRKPVAASPNCADSRTWRKRGNRGRACPWVAQKPAKRCDRESKFGFPASQACRKSCGTC